MMRTKRELAPPAEKGDTVRFLVIANDFRPKVGNTTAKISLDEFLDISRRLTGVEDLAPAQASAYQDRLDAFTREHRLDGGLERLAHEVRAIVAAGGDFEEQVAKRIFGDAIMGEVARQLVFLWYTSAFHANDNLEFGVPEHYFRALIWQVIRAHPPALSGGYFGYWHYPPEN